MSGEIKTNDSQEIKNPNLENYKEIKPQSDMSYVGAKDYWDNTFKTSDGGDSDSQVEYIGEESQEYRDDNGNLYRQGIDLVPNNEYTIPANSEITTTTHFLLGIFEIRISDNS